MSRQLKQAGFTIVELMVATLVFSVILLVITSGVIHFTTSYYKGVHSSATQTTARSITSLITQNLQYGGGASTESDNLSDTHAPVKQVCIGDVHLYSTLGTKLGSGSYGVYVTTNNSACPSDPASGGKELLGSNMRLTNFSIKQIPSGANNLYIVSVGVAFGDDDLLCAKSISPSSDPGGCDASAAPLPAGFDWVTNGATVGCKVGAGSQFCAVSHLTTEVVSRFEAN